MATSKVYSIDVEIQAPASVAWSVMSDAPRWPNWTSTVKEIRLLDAGPLAVGARALVRQPKLPPAVWKVTELLPGRAFTWVNGMPGARVTARHSIEPLGAARCRATLSVENTGLFAPIFNFLTGALTKRYLAIEAAGLKQHSELRAAVVP